MFIELYVLLKLGYFDPGMTDLLNTQIENQHIILDEKIYFVRVIIVKALVWF
jgi:hypothetical protein